MPITLFTASVFFVLTIMRVRRIRFLSPYGIFLTFQILYNVTPWITATLNVGSALFSLLSNKAIIDIQLLLAASANLCFGIVCLFFYKEVRFEPQAQRTSGSMRRNFLWLAVPLFLITCVLCEKYGWHQYTFASHASNGEPPGGMFTVTAYLKFAFVAVYLYYLYRFGLDKGAWILLGEHVVVMVVDGARATFLPIFLVTLFMLIDQSSSRRRLRLIYILAISGFLISMLTRALIFEDSSLIQDVVAPVTIEGAMGDYSSLQSIEGMEQLPSPQYSFGASYLFDPLIWLVPQSLGRERFLFFSRWTNSLSPILDDDFAPLGGFYYVSEAVAAFSYLGPALITTLFACALVWVDRQKNSHRKFYLAWMPTIGLMFVKVPFDNDFKVFLVELIFMQGIYFASKLKIQRSGEPRIELEPLLRRQPVTRGNSW